MSFRIPLLVVIVGLSFFFMVRPASASCVQLTDQEKYDRADLVGIGQIQSRTLGGPILSLSAIFKAAKSPTYNQILVIDEPPATSVDVDWNSGASFLLYLMATSGSNAQYTTTVCDGTRAYEGRYTEAEASVFGIGSRAPLPLPPGRPTVTPSDPATTFSIDYLSLDGYGVNTNPDGLFVSRGILWSLLVAWILLIIVISRKDAENPNSTKRIWQYVVAAVAVLLNLVLLAVEPFGWEYTMSDLPLYALWTATAEATLGCANLRLTIHNLTTLVLGTMAAFVSVIGFIFSLSHSLATRHPRMITALFGILILAQLLPFISIIFQVQYPNGCYYPGR